MTAKVARLFLIYIQFLPPCNNHPGSRLLILIVNGVGLKCFLYYHLVLPQNKSLSQMFQTQISLCFASISIQSIKCFKPELHKSITVSVSS